MARAKQDPTSVVPASASQRIEERIRSLGDWRGETLAGNARRAIDLREGAVLDAEAFQDLFRDAVALNVGSGA